MRRPRLGSVARYSVAVLCVLVAIALRASLTPLWGAKFPYLTLLPAIIMAAWLGGLGPGLLTTILCAAAAVYLWIPPTHSLRIDTPGDLVSLCAFLFIGVTIIILLEVLQRRERQLDRLLETIYDPFVVLDRDWR
jgi:K+-sensing histidine kinase KdpD